MWRGLVTVDPDADGGFRTLDVLPSEWDRGTHYVHTGFEGTDYEPDVITYGWIDAPGRLVVYLGGAAGPEPVSVVIYEPDPTHVYPLP